LILDTYRIIGAFIELLMAENTRMKEIQGELKHISETLGLHHDRFMQMDQRFDKIDQQLQELHQLFLKSQKVFSTAFHFNCFSSSLYEARFSLTLPMSSKW